MSAILFLFLFLVVSTKSKIESLNSIVEENGYKLEKHFVTTDDGCILGLHRIPSKINRDVVILVHGLGASSACWLISNNSLAYVLSNAGYDVWLLNNRGNRYSRHHKTLLNDTLTFDQFSWHEMGIYDLPNTIDYILTETSKSQLILMGHSQGGTESIVMLSEKPEYNKKIKAYIGFCTALTICHIKNPIVLLPFILEQNGAKINFAELITIVKTFLNSIPNMFELLRLICGSPILVNPICNGLLKVTYMTKFEDVDDAFMKRMMKYFPDAFPLKAVLHYVQMIKSCEFRKFDSEKYNVENVDVPIYEFYGQDDVMVTNFDENRLFKLLSKNMKGFYMVEKFDHSDFLFNLHIKQNYGDKVVDILNHL